MARFIDPRVDWAFKRIFGSEDTKECLITFLNGLFEDELVIKDVTFAKTEKLGLRPDDRGVVFGCLLRHKRRQACHRRDAEERTGILCRQSIVLHGTCHCAAGRSWNLGLSFGSSLYGVFYGLCIGESDAKGVSYRLGAY